jgi:hypothetical protein
MRVLANDEVAAMRSFPLRMRMNIADEVSESATEVFRQRPFFYTISTNRKNHDVDSKNNAKGDHAELWREKLQYKKRYNARHDPGCKRFSARLGSPFYGSTALWKPGSTRLGGPGRLNCNHEHQHLWAAAEV